MNQKSQKSENKKSTLTNKEIIEKLDIKEDTFFHVLYNNVSDLKDENMLEFLVGRGITSDEKKLLEGLIGGKIEFIENLTWGEKKKLLLLDFKYRIGSIKDIFPSYDDYLDVVGLWMFGNTIMKTKLKEKGEIIGTLPKEDREGLRDYINKNFTVSEKGDFIRGLCKTNFQNSK